MLLIGIISLGITPLFLASRSGNIPLVRALVRKKADPNQAGASQAIAPLHWAAHKEDTEIALLLIEHGADIQQKDKVGRTPLSLASQDLADKMIGKPDRMLVHVLLSVVFRIECTWLIVCLQFAECILIANC